MINFNDYCVENSQICISPDIVKTLRKLKFIREPYAWLLGQTFKYFLKANQNFENLLNETVTKLKIDFNVPIVG
jgi:hypothetical protein